MDGMHMNHGGHGGMGSMSMEDGVPSHAYLQQMYWAVVGAAIGVATFVNVLNKFLLYQRLANRRSESPAKPNSLFFQLLATSTAIIREFSNATAPFLVRARFRYIPPTLGRVAVILAELILVVVLCFYRLEPEDHWQWEDIGYRTGFIAAAQLPLVVLLAGKNNIIGFLIGSSYERLNWLHRWVSRILFLTVTIHMGFWFRNWARYDYITVKLKTDAITQRGFAAWCILLWIFLSSFAPIRRWNYELFVVQHILTFIGFLAAVFLHLPVEVKAYIWTPIALYIFDRAVRTTFILLTNLSIFHPKTPSSGLLTCMATLEPLSCDTARIVIRNPPVSWTAGQHVFLSCHSIAPLQSHPFTIASIPDDSRMEFLVKCKAGATRRFLTRAEKCQSLPSSQKDFCPPQTFSAVIDGPYGRMRPLRQFDSVVLIAGSSGGSFTIPLMREIVSRWTKVSRKRLLSLPMLDGAVTRYIRFVWVIKSQYQYCWFAPQISLVLETVQQLRSDGHDVEVDMSIYVTCDTDLDVVSKWQSKPRQPLPLQVQLEETNSNQRPPLVEEKLKKGKISIHSSTSISTKEDPSVQNACGPDGKCCCATIIDDEDAIQNADTQQPKCCCCNTASLPAPSSAPVPPNSSINEKVSDASSKMNSLTSRSSSSSLGKTKQSPPSFHPSISVLTGRPHPKTLIRKTLEQSVGESAVVVCGPRGLNQDVKRSVVSLSDERAVHKGTGAQGIYFWEEGFEY